MKRVETHVYRTPTANDPDAWSIGVLSLTREEAYIVQDFCTGPLMARREMAKATAQRAVTIDPVVTQWSESIGRPVTSQEELRKRLDETAPIEPADRFSGLDLG